jgi:hypothetical protein
MPSPRQGGRKSAEIVDFRKAELLCKPFLSKKSFRSRNTVMLALGRDPGVRLPQTC